MKTEFKQPWIVALRSGKYEQRSGFLFKDNKYCCLGVLCKINNLSTYSEQGALSFSHKQLFDLSDTTENYLIRLNDVERKSFSEIADFIEDHL